MMQMPNTPPDRWFDEAVKEAQYEVICKLIKEQQGPSDKELMATYWEGAGLADAGTGAHILRGLRAVLARYGGQP
jgi:hypothetical protein